jgi:hypothetical protein
MIVKEKDLSRGQFYFQFVKNPLNAAATTPAGIRAGMVSGTMHSSQ